MILKRFSAFDVCIFAWVWLLLFTAGRKKLFLDPGSFFHTAAGGHILDSGRLIARDIFSFTRFGEPWIAQQWLGECIMAFIQRLSGLDGLLAVTASLIALLYAGLAARIERSGMNLVMGSLILALALAASSHHFHVRPHIVTILLTAFVYTRLIDVEAGLRHIVSLLYLIPVLVIWANIHGGVLGGLFTLLIAAAGWTLASWLGMKAPIPNIKVLAGLWAFVLLALAAPLANPYGLALPGTWLSIMGSDAVSQLIREHASVPTLVRLGDASSYATISALFFLGLFYMALLAGTDRKDRQFAWFIPLVWFFLSLSRIRHAPLFSVMAVVAIGEIWPHCRWVRRLAGKGLTTFRISERGRVATGGAAVRYLIAFAVTVIALIAFSGSAQLPSTEQKWVRLESSHWPADLLPELQSMEKNRAAGTPIFNDMLFGGFLIYHTPGLRVFIDDRCELYGDEFITKYVNAEQSDFETWARTYGFRIALLLPNSNYRKYFEGNPDWLIVKQCPAAILYLRNDSIVARPVK